jgi:hypothetical protein
MSLVEELWIHFPSHYVARNGLGASVSVTTADVHSDRLEEQR